MSYVTLMTDFGLKDGNVGVMKGVIWGIAAHAQIADISHNIQPQNVPEAALVLFRSAPYFPDHTVHIIVVDPGVGTERRAIAAKIGQQYYVAPDNGVLTMVLERAEEKAEKIRVVHLDQPKYWLPDISHVFHGRDIFAPCGAHLAAGVPLKEMGSLIDDPIRLDLPKPKQTKNGWLGEVIHIDHFGNVASNIRVEHLGAILQHKDQVTIKLNGVEIAGMVDTFGERPVGDLVALMGSTGNLIVSVVNGSAAAKLGTKIGDTFEAAFTP